MNNENQAIFQEFVNRVSQQLGWRIMDKPVPTAVILDISKDVKGGMALLKAKSGSVIGIYSVLGVNTGLNDSNPKAREMGNKAIKGYLFDMRNKELEKRRTSCRWRLMDDGKLKMLVSHQDIDINGLNIEDFKNAVLTVANEEREMTAMFKGAADFLKNQFGRR